MAEGQITRKDIIADDAINWGAEYSKTLDAAIGKNKEFVTAIVALAKANNELRSSQNQTEFVNNQKKTNQLADETIGKWKEQIQLENALSAAKKKNELATESTNRELAKQRILLSEQNKLVNQEAKNQLGLVSVYQKVQNKLNTLGKEYSDLSIRKNLGVKLTNEEIKRYEFLEKKITIYDQALKLTDATQGKHHRNVGNYTSGYNALNNSVNQLTREMPAFANSVSTGFLAISNNIPAFFDALQNIKTKNIELAKSGQPTKSMLSELGGALFSVQSLLSVGVTLLTIYGAKLVQWGVDAYNSSKRIDDAAKSAETLNKAFEDTNVSKAMEDVNQLAINIQLAKDGFIDKNKVVNQYNGTIGKTTGLVSNLNEAEKQLTENGDAYIKMTLYKAAANLALEEAAKQSLKAEQERLKKTEEFKSNTEDIFSAIGRGGAGGYGVDIEKENKAREKRNLARKNAIIKEAEDQAKTQENIAKKFQTDAAKISKSFSFNFFDDNKDNKKTKKSGVADTTFETEKQRLERTIAINNEIVKDSERTDEERLKSLENSENAQIELANKSKENQLKLIEETFNKELKEGNKTDAGLKQLRKNYEAEKIKITEETANKIIDIEENTSKEIKKINQFDETKYTKNLEDKISKTNQVLNAEIQAENERFLALGDIEKLNQKDREKAVEDHEHKIFDIKKRFAIDALKLQVSTLEKQLSDSDALPEGERLSAEKRQKIAESLSKAKADISELEIKNNDSKNTKIEEQEKEFKAKIEDLSTELYSSVKDLANSLFDVKIQKIDDEISKTNEYYDKQMELAGNDQRQKDLLQKERDKKNEELEKKKAEAQKKAAIANKIFALSDIAIKTAQALMAANVAIQTMNAATLGIAGTAYAAWAIPAIYTIAGIQAAAVLATPIPKYKHGRKGGKAEFAEVGDGYVSEVITKADSSSPRVTPNKPTLTFLEQGDIVHKSVDDYNRYMRASILNKFSNDNERVRNFQEHNMFQSNNDKLLLEMQEVNRNLKNQKNTTIVNLPKIDLNYEMWKAKNKNWNQ